jgi:hypothetical protein
MGFNFFHHSHATSSRSPAERQRAQFMYDNDDEKLLYASFCSSYSLLTHSLIRICLLARHNIIVKFSSSSNPSHHLFFSSILTYTYFFLIFILNLKPKWRLQFNFSPQWDEDDFSQQIISIPFADVTHFNGRHSNENTSKSRLYTWQ